MSASNLNYDPPFKTQAASAPLPLELIANTPQYREAAVGGGDVLKRGPRHRGQGCVPACERARGLPLPLGRVRGCVQAGKVSLRPGGDARSGLCPPAPPTSWDLPPCLGAALGATALRPHGPGGPRTERMSRTRLLAPRPRAPERARGLLSSRGAVGSAPAVQVCRPGHCGSCACPPGGPRLTSPRAEAAGLGPVATRTETGFWLWRWLVVWLAG